MAEGVYIRWSLENLITIGLMAAITYFVVAGLAQLFLSNKKKAAPNLSLVA